MCTIRVKQSPVCCMAEAFDRSSWSVFLYAVRDGKATTTYDYTIAGQLASLTTRNLELKTDSSESFLWDGLALIRRGGVNYLNEPHAGGGAALLAGGHQKSAKPKPVAWGDRDFEAVRRHGARSGRPRRSGNVMFNDVLGTTLGVEGEGGTFSTSRYSTYGDSTDHQSRDTDHLFTGKPYVEGLGHAFLLRNYRADLGKWQTADPLGHPDGWNNFTYCNGRVTSMIDLYGGSLHKLGYADLFYNGYSVWDSHFDSDDYVVDYVIDYMFSYDLDIFVSATDSGLSVTSYQVKDETGGFGVYDEINQVSSFIAPEIKVRLAPKYFTDRSKSYCVIYTVKIDVYVKEGFTGNTNVAERKLGQRSFTHTVYIE